MEVNLKDTQFKEENEIKDQNSNAYGIITLNTRIYSLVLKICVNKIKQNLSIVSTKKKSLHLSWTNHSNIELRKYIKYSICFHKMRFIDTFNKRDVARK